MKYFYLGLLGLQLVLTSCSPNQQVKGSVKETMDLVVSRFYKEFTKGQLDTISHDFILNYLSEGEKDILATQYLLFDVNAPVTVSLMRDSAQEVVPFWMEEAGFKRTQHKVRNTHSTYEVWQKNYQPGRIQLGINGFDKHRPVYFVSVGARNSNDNLEITPVFPAEQHLGTMEVGAFTYHDWDGLTLTEVPEALLGQVLFTTIRGRAREAHLVGAFRETIFPSSESPDQLLLTWSGDPKTTVDIQWRTAPSVENGVVKYWTKGKNDTISITAQKFIMEDRLLQNDRFIHRFTAKLTNLQPGTSYEYQLNNDEGPSSNTASFTTEKAETSPFSFIWTGDVHNSDVWGEIIQQTLVKHPENSFYMAAGDLVNTGLHRNDWDELWAYSGTTFSKKPFMAVPGNHDSQDGLGAWMYKEMFSYPQNGPLRSVSEMTYAYHYQNAHFLMIDATLPIEEQAEWVEEQLASSKSDWKFAMFHFPPYNSIEYYKDIIQEWGPLFDLYHVDIVMSGHFHYYLRSKPINGGKVMPTASEGTIYLMSVGTTGKNKEMKPADYAAIQFGADHLYQHVEIDGKNLRSTTYDAEGKILDTFSINK